MERLWAPWRKAYIRPETCRIKGCIFCKLLSEKKDSRNYILKRTSASFAILNLYPYNNGHVMIVPKRHVASIDKLSDAEKIDWLHLYEKTQAALAKTLKAQGFNVGMNIGKIAGAGIPGHVHLHIVPRWKGDSNFMPVTSFTKVISESLDSVYKILSRELNHKS